MNAHLKMTAGILTAVVLQGCMTAPSAQRGFLDDYSRFEESNRLPGTLVDRTRADRLKNYKACIVEPVAVHFKNQARFMEIKPEDRKILTEYFHDEVVNAVHNGGYTVVNDSGPGVLRIRLAITDILADKPYWNSYRAIRMSKEGVGGLGMEAEFLDSSTGERLAAVIDAHHGRGWQIRQGPAWGIAREACSQWAATVLNFLREPNHRYSSGALSQDKFVSEKGVKP